MATRLETGYYLSVHLLLPAASHDLRHEDQPADYQASSLCVFGKARYYQKLGTMGIENYALVSR